VARSIYTGEHDSAGPLFDRPIRPLARTSDPETSHESARRVKKSGALAAGCWDTMAALRQYLALWGSPPTTAELAGGDAALIHLYGRRLPDLREAGLVRNPSWADGQPMKRRCAKTGSSCMTWEPTQVPR
jgi:hypothetical protein